MGVELRFELLLLLRLLLLLLLGGTYPTATAQNPFEQMAIGALSVGSGIMNSLQEGAKVSKQMSFDTGLVAAKSKTDIGFGDAMRGAEDDSDSSESQERRKRRSPSGRGDSLHQLLHRVRRMPCKMMGATAPPQPADDDVEARRRRARKRAANNASRSRVNKSKSKKKNLARRRRQAEQQAPQAPRQPQQGPSLGERVRYFWLSLVDNVADAVQQMRERIKGAAAQASSGVQSI